MSRPSLSVSPQVTNPSGHSCQDPCGMRRTQVRGPRPWGAQASVGDGHGQREGCRGKAKLRLWKTGGFTRLTRGWDALFPVQGTTPTPASSGQSKQEAGGQSQGPTPAPPQLCCSHTHTHTTSPQLPRGARGQLLRQALTWCPIGHTVPTREPTTCLSPPLLTQEGERETGCQSPRMPPGSPQLTHHSRGAGEP